VVLRPVDFDDWIEPEELDHSQMQWSFASEGFLSQANHFSENEQVRYKRIEELLLKFLLAGVN